MQFSMALTRNGRRLWLKILKKLSHDIGEKEAVEESKSEGKEKRALALRFTG